jgi:uncharacterized protein HemX
MATPKKVKKEVKSSTKIAVGAGLLAAVAAGAAGYYFYGDKNAKKHRASASKWTKDMKQDVLREVKKLKKIDQKSIASIIDTATKAYANIESVTTEDLRKAGAELKKHWKEIEKETLITSKKVAPLVKKTVKAAQKIAKK